MLMRRSGSLKVNLSEENVKASDQDLKVWFVAARVCLLLLFSVITII